MLASPACGPEHISALVGRGRGRAATSFPPCVQGDLIFSTTYPEIVFENCVISIEFGLEGLGTVFGRVCGPHLPPPRHASLFPLVSRTAVTTGGGGCTRGGWEVWELDTHGIRKKPLEISAPTTGGDVSQK